MNPGEFYNKQIEDYAQKVAILKKKSIRLSAIRFTSFIAAIAIFFINKGAIEISIGISLTLIATFFISIRKFFQCKDEIKYSEKLIEVCKNELLALDYKFDQFADGELYQHHEHPYSYDLDIFGEGSLFQMLNRTSTCKGEATLAEHLTNLILDPNEINRHQQAVKEIGAMPDFQVNFRTAGELTPDTDKDIEQLKKWLQEKYPLPNRSFRNILRFVSPLVLILLIVGSIFYSPLSQYTGLLFITNLFIIGFSLRKINRYQSVASKNTDLLKKYMRMLLNIEKNQWKSELLTGLASSNSMKGVSASEAIRDLNRMINNFENRMNIFGAIFLEGLFLWDLHYLEKIENWKSTYGEKLMDWITVITKFDVLTSLSTYTYNNPEYIYPKLTSKYVLNVEEMGHPLIKPSTRVCNNLQLNKKGDFVIITGANMSGKSTFLRTVAINMILAMAGVPVCAKRMELYPRRIYSSMRTSDSLSKNESYFYAELLRLKHILEELEQGKDTFIILDEILKGTNSHDKQVGSRKVLEKIIKLNGTGLIATHDLELTKIEQD
ncbi:MAG: hypothetical protein MI922_28915 [Bacteroidales bacterium]|nr:hypothetical protein [Bacteroidales bacterium]